MVPMASDVFRISAELRDVFLHPLDSGTLIQESEIRIWFAVAAFYGLLAPPSPSEWPVDSNWERVYVGDKGINIVGFRYAYALI